MPENLKDILSNLSPEVDQQALLLYLQGKLTAEQQHQLEKDMMANDFSSDALEGLGEIKDDKKIQALVDQLNTQLRKNTRKRKENNRKLELKQPPWTYLSIILVLLLVIISYFIIHRYMQG